MKKLAFSDNINEAFTCSFYLCKLIICNLSLHNELNYFICNICLYIQVKFNSPFQFGVLFEEISPVESAGTSIDPLGYLSQVFWKIGEINFIEPFARYDGIMDNLSTAEI